MPSVNSLSSRLHRIPALRRLSHRYGRAYWRLPSILRRRLHWETDVPGLRGAQTWRFGQEARVARVESLATVERPTLGHLLAAQPFHTRAPYVTRLDRAWLIGKFASPVTLDGRLIPSAFRDQPGMLGLERHRELETWLRAPISQGEHLPELENVWPMVNRLQANYFHWLIEWCGRLELIEAYREQTGSTPRLVIPDTGPAYLRESLALLGFGPECWIPWAEDAAPRPVRHLLLPSLRESTVAPAPSVLQWLRRRLLTAAGAEETEAGRVIYLSRPRQGWRSVLNDEEVAEWFRGEGHEVLQPHRLPLAEQIRQFSKASLIVGLHGAGLTNILFAPQATLIELTGDYGDGVYFSMAARLGQSYSALPCRSVGDDAVVDLADLRRRVAACLKGGLTHV